MDYQIQVEDGTVSLFERMSKHYFTGLVDLPTLCPTLGKINCGEKDIDDLHLEYFQSFIILIQKERNRLGSSLTIGHKANGSQSSVVPLVFWVQTMLFVV